MATAVEEALNKLEIKEQMITAAQEWGCTPAQAADFAELRAPLFGLVAGTATHIHGNAKWKAGQGGRKG